MVRLNISCVSLSCGTWSASSCKQGGTWSASSEIDTHGIFADTLMYHTHEIFQACGTWGASSQSDTYGIFTHKIPPRVGGREPYHDWSCDSFSALLMVKEGFVSGDLKVVFCLCDTNTRRTPLIAKWYLGGPFTNSLMTKGKMDGMSLI